MMRERTQVHANALFGSTNCADSVPDGSASDDLHEGDDEPAGEEPFEQGGPHNDLSVLLSPAEGPVYLEGRLVLSLSFKIAGEQARWLSTLAGRMGELELPPIRRGKPLECYRIWDDVAGDWLSGSPTVLRFENADVVECGEDRQIPVWTGSVDVRKRVISVPDLDGAGIAANLRHDLRWKRCEI